MESKLFHETGVWLQWCMVIHLVTGVSLWSLQRLRTPGTTCKYAEGRVNIIVCKVHAKIERDFDL